MSRSKKSEQHCRDKFEIFIHLFDEHFVRHFESHRRETWRHTGRRIEPVIPLETPSPLPPPPPSPLIFDKFHVPDVLIVLLYMWRLNSQGYWFKQKQPYELSTSDSRN